MARIDDVVSQVRSYLPEADLERLTAAFDFATMVHSGQNHPSGTSYLDHLLEVSYTLAAMRLDLDTVIAGLLHSVFKGKTPPTTEDLSKHLGKDVAAIVTGATRITNIGFNSKLSWQAENVRKLLVAMAQDVRVIIVRLVDRLQDMFLLDHYDRKKQRDLSQETLDLYAPLAGRLGIDWIKRELEDLSFKYLNPEAYQALLMQLETSAGERSVYVQEVIKILRESLNAAGIKPVAVLGRPKHLYSIHRKLLVQKIPLEKVYDRVAFRVIVESKDECYAVIAAIHKHWQAIDGRFKDFIGSPKANNYQSIHTSVIGPGNQFMEVQVRTVEMDRVAQEGIAAHWAYKTGQKIRERDVRLFRELKHLTIRLQDVQDPQDFLDSVKNELYVQDVYALTPTGDVKGFPQGSTPLDFAYSIHTSVGDHCSGARVNNRMVPLSYALVNGDVVEIITSTKQNPRRGWLSLVKTARARSRIRQWLRQDENERYIAAGREICERILVKHHLSLKQIIRTGHVKQILQSLACGTLENLLQRVGAGLITAHALEKAMQPKELQKDEEAFFRQRVRKKEKVLASKAGVVEIDGMAGVLIRISQCCQPLPGDVIVGFITTGTGVSIHKSSCAKLLATDPSRRLTARWAGTGEKLTLSLCIYTENRKGMVADVSAACSRLDADIVSFNATGIDDGSGRIDVILLVRDREQMARIVAALEQTDGVLRIATC